jgi:hypothetical protein
MKNAVHSPHLTPIRFSLHRPETKSEPFLALIVRALIDLMHRLHRKKNRPGFMPGPFWSL